MKIRNIEWVTTRCVVCGMKLDFIKSIFLPKTCNNFDCSNEYKTHKEKYLKGGGKSLNKTTQGHTAKTN